MEQSREIQVWDPLVRVGHWALVAAFFVAYFTEDELLGVHTWAGYVAAAYVAVRVVWGFVGPEHTRFRDFAYGPGQAVRYLVGLVRARSPRFLGHSPAGAMMVFALLFMLTGTALTGMADLAQSRGEGPLAAVIAQRPQPVERSGGDEHEDARRSDAGEESELHELHELFANLTLILVGFHLAGVALASWAHKENLVRAMVTGRKRVDDPPAPIDRT
jgi:cytochrome b